MTTPDELIFSERREGCRPERFAAGEVIVRVGEPGDAAWFILEGEVRATPREGVARTMGPGQCVGELAVLRGEPRSADVVALTELRMLRVEAEAFKQLVAERGALRALLATQEQVYRGPDGDTSTTVHRGRCEGEPSVTSVVSYADGRRFSATRLDASGRMIWTELSRTGGPRTGLLHEAEDRRRVLWLDAEDRIHRIEASGELEGIDGLVASLARGRPLKPATQERFRALGALSAPKGVALLCACVGLSEQAAGELEPARLREQTGAGSLCGSCERKLERLGATRPPSPAPAAPGLPGLEALSRLSYPEFVDQALKGELALPSPPEMNARLRAERPELFRPSNLAAAVTLGGVVLRIALTFAAMLWLMQGSLWPLLLPLWVLQGLNYYGLAAMLHELTHDTVFTSRRLNRLAGGLLAPPMLFGFGAMKRSHAIHHRWSQSRKDPKAPKSTNQTVKRLSILTFKRWLADAPRLRDAVMVAMLFFGATPQLLATTEFTVLQRPRQVGEVLDLMFLVAVWVAAFAWLGPWAVALTLGVPMVLGFAMVTIVFHTHMGERAIFTKFPEASDFELMILNITNITLGPWFDRRCFGFHRYHIEHHYFPTLPYYALEEAAAFLARDYGAFIPPPARFGLEFLRRGFLGFVIDYTPMTLGGREFWVGPHFRTAPYPVARRGAEPR
ncbi:MAG: fatty acid desaturase [Alphaproteobacteria bacterium]|nr:fatty acid desaturase [Alphaproteobacteria bacterium]